METEEEQIKRIQEAQDSKLMFRTMGPQRIGFIMGWLLIGTALLVDIIELILEWLGVGLVINIVTTPAAWLLFWIWFLMLGVTYSSNTKKFAVALIQPLVELVPGLDATIVLSFMWTLGMILIVGMTRMEDRGEEPTISGGLLEGFKIVTLVQPLAPHFFATGVALAAADKARRATKQRKNQRLAQRKPNKPTISRSKNTLDLKNNSSDLKKVT